MGGGDGGRIIFMALTPVTAWTMRAFSSDSYHRLLGAFDLVDSVILLVSGIVLPEVLLVCYDEEYALTRLPVKALYMKSR